MSGAWPPGREPPEALAAAMLFCDGLGLAITDDGGRFVTVGSGWTGLTGYEQQELVGQPFTAALAEDGGHSHESGQLLAELERAGPAEQKLRAKSGKAVEALVTVSTLRDLEGRQFRALCAVPLAEFKRREELRSTEERMAAVSRLAGGTAHSLNNVLTIITGYSQLLRQELNPPEAAWAYADEIFRAAEQAAALAGKLLAFSRRRIAEPERLDLNLLLRKMEPALRKGLPRRSGLTFDLASGLPRVFVDPSHLEQVIVSLVENAAEAMPRGGAVLLRTGQVEFTVEHQPAGDLRPGRYVLLAVEDTGSGIDPELARHIFEPFFSSKGPGKGTGLALVYGTVKQCGGDVRVSSEPGRGTTVTVYLPAEDMG